LRWSSCGACPTVPLTPGAAEAVLTTAVVEPKHEAAADPHDEHNVEHEVDLGTFSLTVSVARSKPLLLSFHLYGTLNESKHSEFAARYEAQHHRLRQEVLVLLRGTDLTLLTDPDLTELKKQLLARINRLLGKASLNEVIVSRFRHSRALAPLAQALIGLAR